MHLLLIERKALNELEGKDTLICCINSLAFQEEGNFFRFLPAWKINYAASLSSLEFLWFNQRPPESMEE
jgi:hypothetical protein